MALWFVPSLPAGKLIILFTNDLHGRLEPRNLVGDARAGGAPAILAIKEKLQAGLEADQDLLLVDSGDFLFGGSRGDQARGATTIELMNRVGYAATALGNHEFDLGWKVLEPRAREAKFPMLAANLYGQHRVAPPGIRPSQLLILPRSGLRVGLIGVTQPGSTPTGPHSAMPGLRFGDPGEAIEREIFRLQGQRADIILLLSHLGSEAEKELLQQVPRGIDAVIGGHHPTGRVDTKVKGIRLLQAAAEGRELGRLDLETRLGKPAKTRVRWLPLATLEVNSGPLDEILAAHGAPTIALGRSEKRWSFRETCGWILDSMLTRAQTRGLQADVAVVNRGAIRASLPRGKVFEQTLRRIAPFDNHLVHLRVPATTLRRLLLRTEGKPLLYRLAKGTELPRRGNVSVVLNDFLAQGGDGCQALARVRRRRVLPETVRGALRRDLSDRAGVLEPPTPVPQEMARGARPTPRKNP